MKNIAVVMGGYSEECQVSLKSGQTILKHIDKNIFTPYEVHILEKGWFALVNGQKYDIDKRDFSFQMEQEKISFDAVFNIIHGTPGEDGLLQAYWDIIGLPYTGCGHYLSGLTFNKKDCIAVLKKYGIPAAKSIYISKGQTIDTTEIVSTLGLPCFVKPNQSGSSLGISKVQKEEDFPEALKKAFAEDDDVLVEEFIDGTEVSVGVVQFQGKTIVSGITEIVAFNDFFDYDAKYNGDSEEITPARIDESERKKVEEIAQLAYNSLRMKGMSRSEYILRDGIPYFIEMNTLPGFSPASILPQQLAHSGISITDFISSELTGVLK